MTTAPANHDFTIYQGATFSEVLTWRDSSEELVNLTGYTARMQVRNRIDGDTVVSLTTENSRIELGGSAGTITLTISATDTAALSEGGVYDLELISAGGIVTRLLEGAVAFSKEVTK